MLKYIDRKSGQKLSLDEFLLIFLIVRMKLI